ncbi:hypothetical protein U9M48_010110 [Paspalum notatum var. saurae]|uniref:TLC domain-containing protein n=1 Tax=Paspalum notatum var. saurae TaxID=547442 RepID=A0AAQ3WFS3_PASNO
MTAMAAYKYQAQALMRDYLLADPLLPYTSVLIGIVLCKMAYDVTRILSSFYFKGYTLLTKIQRIEWNNRGMSSAHAIFITAVSLYLVVLTDLFSDRVKGPITFRNSVISTSALGVSVGYFITDLAMIFWLYPSLGGMEYVLHHTLSLVAIAYTMLSGEGQFYTYMVLISESTTPEINLRWFLDTAGLKKSSAYLVNGILMFVAWLVRGKDIFVHIRILPHPFTLQSDNTDARLWVLPDICCAISALCNEHNVVHEDPKRGEENTGKMAMMDNAKTKRIPELSTRFGITA